MATNSSGSTPNSAASASTACRLGHGKIARSTRGSAGALRAACQPRRTAAGPKPRTASPSLQASKASTSCCGERPSIMRTSVSAALSRPASSSVSSRPSHAATAGGGGGGGGAASRSGGNRSEEHTSELQSQSNLVCRLLLEKKKKNAKHGHP